MSKTCVKCGYVRLPSDTAPDYECPKCGVIYAKAEAAVANGALLRSRPKGVETRQEVPKAVNTAPASVFGESDISGHGGGDSESRPWVDAKPAIESQRRSNLRHDKSRLSHIEYKSEAYEPFVVRVLFVLSLLSILGGLVMAVVLWPGRNVGDDSKAFGYSASVIAITAGIVQSTLFAALSKIVAYLCRIEFNTRKAL